MSSIDRIKQQKRAIINQYSTPDDVKGFTQVVTTLAPLALLWYAVVLSATLSLWLTAGITLLMSLFILRAFVLMHECGHASLFRSDKLNKTFGFVFGVVTGMPQYVWSQHHAYHHATNGNWSKYRGPLSTMSTDEFAALTEDEQERYQIARNIRMAPVAGFIYLIFNPRITWLKGSLQFVAHVVKGKIAQPNVSLQAHAALFKTRYWNSPTEYWHMFWNNVVLLSAWVVMAHYVGVVLFFAVYVVSVSLAGAAGLVLFTVQHNFEHAYASEDEGWDYDTAAILGTSFLLFPRWLHWFTASIAYHHIHHLSAKIPNYRLAQCHAEYAHLFGDVARVKLRDLHRALQFILWDVRTRRIISVAEYRAQKGGI